MLTVRLSENFGSCKFSQLTLLIGIVRLVNCPNCILFVSEILTLRVRHKFMCLNCIKKNSLVSLHDLFWWRVVTSEAINVSSLAIMENLLLAVKYPFSINLSRNRLGHFLPDFMSCALKSLNK